MCGIFGCFSSHKSICLTKLQIESILNSLKHRGPDNFSIYDDENSKLIFTRLAINDLTDKGLQPFYNNDWLLICNGEIYNWKEINEFTNYNPSNNNISDCEYILPLFSKLNYDIEKLALYLDGEYSMILYNMKSMFAYVLTDRLGLRQLYYGYNNNQLFISSEMKAIYDICENIEVFPSGHYAKFEINNINYFKPIKYLYLNNIEKVELSYNHILEKLRTLYIESVKDKLHSDADIGFLLSGGLDSSLNVCVARYLQPEKEILTFTIGFSEDSPDIKAARLVAKHCNTKHHEYIVSFEEALSVIPEVIKCIETYDTTTIRASTLQYLLSYNIRKQYKNLKVLIAGETADELHAGYMCFNDAPTAYENKLERIKMLEEIKHYDAKRADLTSMNFSFEIRFPHVSKKLLEFIFSINDEYFTNSICEKRLLRESFAGLNIIPEEIRTRTKAAFSDATSKKSSWKSKILDYAKLIVDFNDMDKYDGLKPRTEEELLYRQLFESYYGKKHTGILKHFWEPNPKWYKIAIRDPSATVLGNYKKDQFD